MLLLISEHLLIFVPTPTPRLPHLSGQLPWLGLTLPPVKVRYPFLGFRILLHHYSSHLRCCVMIITIWKDVIPLGKSLTVKDLLLKNFKKVRCVDACPDRFAS